MSFKWFIQYGGKQSGRDKGFTLIEVLIAMVIFAIGILGVAKMQISAINGNASARRMTDSVVIASDQIETLMTLSYTDSDLDGTGGTPREPAVQPLAGYNLSWTVKDITDDSTIPPDSKLVTVTVTQDQASNANRSVVIQQIISEME